MTDGETTTVAESETTVAEGETAVGESETAVAEGETAVADDETETTAAEEADTRDDAHLDDVDVSCGCAEVWETLSEQRRQ